MKNNDTAANAVIWLGIILAALYLLAQVVRWLVWVL